MGLYLCVFDEDEEIDGVEVGSYADFAAFRNCVTKYLEGGKAGSRFPVLIGHHDSDGAWSVDECRELEGELNQIAALLQHLPAVEFSGDWQAEVAKLVGLRPTSLFDSFIDVDGEPLIQRMISLCRVALQRNKPLLFQ